MTPSNATKILSLLTTALDKVNVVVLPLAVNVSTLLSEISNVGKLFATRFPKITSEDDGADANTRIDPTSVPYPFDGFGVSCGLCITPLCEMNSCADLVICALVPPLCVTTNFLLTPSNATLNV